MSSIQPTSSMVGSLMSNLSSPAASQQEQAAPGFGQALMGALENVDGDQQTATSRIQELLSGKTKESLPVIMSVAKADLSFKLLMGVRNKVIDAYKQTMSMQV